MASLDRRGVRELALVEVSEKQPCSTLSVTRGVAGWRLQVRVLVARLGKKNDAKVDSITNSALHLTRSSCCRPLRRSITPSLGQWPALSALPPPLRRRAPRWAHLSCLWAEHLSCHCCKRANALHRASVRLHG